MSQAALTLIADVKTRLRMDAFETKFDTLLTNFILSVSGRFEKECGRLFARSAAATQEFPGDETELRVVRYPIESVTSFALKTNETDGFVTQTGVDYLIRNACVVSLPAAIGDWRQQLKLTFAGGYVLPADTAEAGQTALPEDLEQACIDQVAHFFASRDRLGLTSISGEGGSIQAFSKLDLLPHVAELIGRYRRYSL